MSFLNLNDLEEAVGREEQFQHEIKGKRLRRELDNLKEYENPGVTFKSYEMSNSGLSFMVLLKRQRLKSSTGSGRTTSKCCWIWSTPSRRPKCSIATRPAAGVTARAYSTACWTSGGVPQCY